MKKVSTVLGSIIDRRSAALLSARMMLNEMWEETVGERLAAVTSLDELKFINKDELLVTIKILSSAMAFAKYSTSEITLKISKMNGGRTVQLYFKKTTSIQKVIVVKEQAEEPIPSKERQALDLDFENVALKHALETMKTEMQDAA
ncbi:MAG: hypothetical protein LBF56_03500 [Holosporales bacterium]|nr:hypothetical protein [Holosporales bacterium]